MGSLCPTPADSGRSRAGLCRVRMLNATRTPGRNGLSAQPSAAGWQGSGPAAGFVHALIFVPMGLPQTAAC